MTDDARIRQINRVRTWMKQAGIGSMTEFARLAGIRPSTLNKKITGADQSMLSARTMEKLEAVARRDKGPVEFPEKIATLDVQVIGAVQAGEWLEALEWPEEDQWIIGVPTGFGWGDLPMYALEVRGPSMNRVYPDKTVIVCVNPNDLGKHPAHGDHVVVRRHGGNGLVEATVKVYRIDGDGNAWLWPDSDDPRHQEPIDLGDEEVEIVGIVVGSFAPRMDLRKLGRIGNA